MSLVLVAVLAFIAGSAAGVVGTAYAAKKGLILPEKL